MMRLQWQQKLEANKDKTTLQEKREEFTVIFQSPEGTYTIEGTPLSQVFQWKWGKLTTGSPQLMTHILEEFGIDPHSGWR